MTTTNPRNRPGSILLLVATWLPGLAMAADHPPATPDTPAASATFVDAMTGGKAHLEFRYRLETVDQDPFADDAVASTLRSRLN